MEWKSEDPDKHTSSINPMKHAESPVDYPNALTSGSKNLTLNVVVNGTMTTNPGTGSVNVVITTDPSLVTKLIVASPSGKRGGPKKVNNSGDHATLTVVT